MEPYSLRQSQITDPEAFRFPSAGVRLFREANTNRSGAHQNLRPRNYSRHSYPLSLSGVLNLSWLPSCAAGAVAVSAKEFFPLRGHRPQPVS